MPDIDVSDLPSAASFRSALIDRGAILIRNVVPPDVIGALSAAVGRMFDHFEGIPKASLERGRDVEAPERRSMWNEIINDGVHYNYDVVVASRGACSIYDVIEKSPLGDLVAQAFPNAETSFSHASCVRRMTGEAASAPVYRDDALDAHIDAMVHQRDALVLNCWTPLTDAGIDQPGLAVIPIGIKATLDYVEHRDEGYPTENPLNIDGPHMRYFRADKMTSETLAAEGMEFWRPQMHPGDVLVFTNYTIHATSRAPGMTGSRTSIEARIRIGDAKIGESGLALGF